MKREIDHIADSDKKVEQTDESAQNVQNGDLIQRKAAIEAINGMIDRFERILADLAIGDDSVCGMCEYDGAYIGQSGDWCNECPGFDKDDCFKLSDECRKRWMGDIALPSAQPELGKNTMPQQPKMDRLGVKTGETCTDTISRQAAIDLFPNDALEWDTKGGYIAPHLARRMIEELPSAQPEQKTDEWIPISKETNPTKSGWYLVTSHENATIENKLFTVIAEFNATNGMWYDIDEPTDMYLRWMPLPEPYRGGDK